MTDINNSRRDVGRVVFPKDPTNRTWTVLTLKCHVDNVTTLAKRWSHESAYLNRNLTSITATKSALVKAAEIHDDAKPQKFRLEFKRFKNNPPEWSYSFAGHRFEVPRTDDLYVDELVRMHHEYSVTGITEAMAKLRLDPRYRELYRNFPLDLYALEMADQIEATLARAALDADEPEGRVFMDFDFDTDDVARRRYRIDPFPFVPDESGDIRLMIEYAYFEIPDAADKEIRREFGKDPYSPVLRDRLNELRTALVEELQTATLESQAVEVCRW